MSDSFLHVPLLSIYSRCIDMSESLVIKMSRSITLREEMELLCKSDDVFLVDVLNFIGSASKPHWKKRLYYSSAQNLHLSGGFYSTIGINPSSTDAPLVVLTRAVTGLRRMLELQRRTSRRDISIDMNIFFAKMIRLIWMPLKYL